MAKAARRRVVFSGAMTVPMILAITGGRHYSDRDALFRALDAIHEETPITLLVHGGASGADTLAGEWAMVTGVPVRVFRADWSKFGRSAGPRRNGAMLREARPGLVLACPGGAGTADCVRQAESLGLRVERVPAR